MCAGGPGCSPGEYGLWGRLRSGRAPRGYRSAPRALLERPWPAARGIGNTKATAAELVSALGGKADAKKVNAAVTEQLKG